MHPLLASTLLYELSPHRGEEMPLDVPGSRLILALASDEITAAVPANKKPLTPSDQTLAFLLAPMLLLFGWTHARAPAGEGRGIQMKKCRCCNEEAGSDTITLTAFIHPSGGSDF